MKSLTLGLCALLSSVSAVTLSNRKVYEIDNSLQCGSSFKMDHFSEEYSHVVIKGYQRVNCKIVPPAGLCFDEEMISKLTSKGVVVALQIGGEGFDWDSASTPCAPTNWGSLEDEIINVMLTQPTTYKMVFNAIHFSYAPGSRTPWTPADHNTRLTNLQTLVSSLKKRLPPFDASIEIQDAYIAQQATAEYENFIKIIPELEKVFELLTIRTGLVSSLPYSLVLEPTNCAVSAAYGVPPCSSPQTLITNLAEGFPVSRMLLSSCVGSGTGCIENVLKPVTEFIANGCYGGFSATETTNSWGVVSHFQTIDMPSWNITESRKRCLSKAAAPSTLTNDIVQLAYYTPDSPLYRSSRYDWSSGSGAVLARAIDDFGVLRFDFDVMRIPPAHNPTNPNSMFGLMAEFGCGAQSQWCDDGSQVTNGVLGFETNQAEFLKIGVGRLSRSRDLVADYDPKVAYPISQPLSWNTSCTTTGCTFKASDSLTRGATRWGYDLTRTVTMTENGTITSDVYLTNTGTISFRTAYITTSTLSIENKTWGTSMTVDLESFPDINSMTCPSITEGLDCLKPLSTEILAGSDGPWFLGETAYSYNLSGSRMASGSFAPSAGSGSNFEMFYSQYTTSQTVVRVIRTFTAGTQLVLASLNMLGLGPYMCIMGVYNGVEVQPSAQTQWSESAKVEVLFKTAPGGQVATSALLIAIFLLVVSIGCIVAGNKFNIGGNKKEEGMAELQEEDANSHNHNPMHPEDRALE